MLDLKQICSRTFLIPMQHLLFHNFIFFLSHFLQLLLLLSLLSLLPLLSPCLLTFFVTFVTFFTHVSTPTRRRTTTKQSRARGQKPLFSIKTSLIIDQTLIFLVFKVENLHINNIQSSWPGRVPLSWIVILQNRYHYHFNEMSFDVILPITY